MPWPRPPPGRRRRSPRRERVTQSKGRSGRGQHGKKSRSGAGGRQLAVRLDSSKRRTASSRRWLERQLSDPYVARARSEGYRSRAAYKLIELDERFHLFARGQRVVDLGAAPGGWTQVAVERVGAEPGGPGHVVAIDVLPMDPVPGAIVLTHDFMAADAPDLLRAALGGPADVVLSDMAAPATGHTATDHLRIMALCEVALDFAESVLAPGGSFVAKVLRGGTERTLYERLRRDFAKVRHAKPPASRAESAESYVVATGFRAASPDRSEH